MHINLLFLSVFLFNPCKLDVLYHSAEANKNMTINELDELIIEELTNPKEGGGKRLLKHAFKYYLTLEEVEELVKVDDPYGFEIGRNMTCGPRWIATRYDEKVLKETYNFKNSDLLHLNATIESTYNKWQNIIKMFEAVD